MQYISIRKADRARCAGTYLYYVYIYIVTLSLLSCTGYYAGPPASTLYPTQPDGEALPQPAGVACDGDKCHPYQTIRAAGAIVTLHHRGSGRVALQG